jgi:hypothetical protein
VHQLLTTPMQRLDQPRILHPLQHFHHMANLYVGDRPITQRLSLEHLIENVTL